MVQELVDAIEKLIGSQINDLHTAIPAEIVEFNEDDCTVDVMPKAKIRLTTGQEVAYPRINNVPLLFPCGAGQGVVIAFPVQKGDGCLLIFSEKALDYWQGSGVASSENKFALSNAIAIPGLYAKPSREILKAVQDKSLIIKNDNTQVSLTGSKISIIGDIELQGNLTLTGEIKSSQGT